MNSAEQTVTWLITLGVLESPKKSISDPEAFLQSSLRDGVVLCKLLDRLRPGSVEKVIPEPRSDGECQENIGEFLKGCGAFRVEVFEVNDLLQGLNFTKVLNSLVALNKATEVIGVGEDSGCSRHSSLRIKSFDCLHTAPHTHSSKQPHNQYRSLDMSEGIGQQLLVKARFAFQPTNEDELSFSKGDVISVGRQEDGGWWEGTFNGKTGWFPSNYVREVKGCEKPISPKSGTLKSPLKALDTTAISKTYYNVVLQNILETETEFSTELQTLLTSYLRSLHTTDRWTSADISTIQGNLEEISTFQQILVQSLEERLKLPENQQRVGAFFLSLIPQMSSLYVAYCSNHPSAVSLLTQHSAELGEFMESQGASSPGILTLTTGLSKPFTRLDRYPALLLELDRHMEDHHPDQPDIQKCMAAFKNLAAQCQRVRKRRELELQILSDAVVGWEGDDITTLGPVLHMTQASVQSQSQENGERYLLLFPHVLLMLSTSPRMSGFIYQGKLSLAGLSVSRLDDDDNLKNAFQITGAQCEPLQVVCNGPQDFQEWMEHLHHLTKPDPALTKPPLTVTMPTLRSPPPAVTTPILRTPPPVVTTPTLRTLPAPCHTMPSQPLTPPRHSDGRTVSGGSVYHTLPHLSSCQGTPHASLAWPPLEPPAPPKPWSLSCLRPAPPLHPAGAPGYKEDLSKSPKSMKKLLPKRKPERKPSEEDFITRKSTAALEEDAQILKVIEAYCTSAKTRQTLNSSSRKESGVHLLFPEEERIIVEETRSNGQTVMEEKSLVDTVYGLRDEVQELKQDNKRMRRSLEEEQRARKDLEKMVRRVLKNMNDPTWDETNL